MDLVPILLQRLDVTAELIGNVKADQLGDASNCAGWTVRDLLNHYIGGELGLAMALAGNPLDVTGTPPDFVGDAGDDPKAAHDQAIEKVKQAWTTPGARDKETIPVGDGMPTTMALRIALLEAVVHGWDIARSTNQPYEIPDMLAQPILSGLQATVGDGPRPEGHFFGSPVEVPDDASAADKLIAFTGRTP